jgi:uncharacterized membrane protein
MRKIDVSATLFAGVSIAYPLFAAFAVRIVGPLWLAIGLCVLLALRAALGARSEIPIALTGGLLFVAAAVALVTLYDRTLAVRLYPAFMSAAMAAAFGQTLLRGPTMIERFARILEPDLGPAGVRYARAVTWVWVGFFVINGALALFTAIYASWRIWALYNGVIAYIAMGALFAGECFIVRPRVKRATKDAH